MKPKASIMIYKEGPDCPILARSLDLAQLVDDLGAMLEASEHEMLRGTDWEVCDRIRALGETLGEFLD